MTVMKDESFGPLIGIMKVKDDEEAIQLMQDTEYGLTASVYSSNRKRAENILQQINAGTGYWNALERTKTFGIRRYAFACGIKGFCEA